MNAIYHAHADGKRNATQATDLKWRKAAAEKRIKTRKLRGAAGVKVWIEPAVLVDQKLIRSKSNGRST
jgi:hypothetical protein